MAKQKTQTLEPDFNKDENQSDENLTSNVIHAFEEAVSVSEQLEASIKELNSATKSQTSGIEEVSQSLQSISTAIQGVAANATKAMEMMKKSEEITQRINMDAEKGMKRMDDMKSIVSESTNDVKTLATELSKVDNMTNFITQIAEQTNLLALNAAIEAARAGDVGRGFAVVADEVRRLAENSKKGAGDISELIGSLKESSSKTTDSIQRGNSIVKDSYDMIQNILKSIQTITDSITEVLSQMQEISAATEQVSSGTEEATAASEEILSVAQTNMQSFEELAGAKDKETAILKNANLSTKNLTEISKASETSTMLSITDIDGNFTYLNQEFLILSKYPREELIGETDKILQSDWHDSELFENQWKIVSSGKKYEGYVRNQAKDGSIYWTKTVIVPTLNENQEISGYVKIMTPINELMNLIGVEDAIDEQIQGKPLSNPKIKPVLEKLRLGKL